MSSKNAENIGLSQEKLQEIMTKVGLPTTPQSGFTRIDSPSGAKMYVAVTKAVRRIDLSGWPCLDGREDPGPDFGVVKPNQKDNGKVHHQLDQRAGQVTEEKALENFELLLELMKSLPAKVVAAPKPKKEKTADPGKEAAKGAAQPNGGVAALDAELEAALARDRASREPSNMDKLCAEADQLTDSIKAKVSALPDAEPGDAPTEPVFTSRVVPDTSIVETEVRDAATGELKAVDIGVI